MRMKFWHVTVFAKIEGKTKTIFQKQCLTVGEANELLKQKKEEFSGPEYSVLKENF